MYSFVVDFVKFIVDNESIENEDLVVWVIVGVMYVFYFEDILNIVIVVNLVSFYFWLYNFFDEDFLMVLYDVVFILLNKGGVDINIFGIF